MGQAAGRRPVEGTLGLGSSPSTRRRCPTRASHFYCVDLYLLISHLDPGPFLFCNYYELIAWILLLPLHSHRCALWTAHSLGLRRRPQGTAPCPHHAEGPSLQKAFLLELTAQTVSTCRQVAHSSLAILGSLEKQVEFLWW